MSDDLDCDCCCVNNCVNVLCCALIGFPIYGVFWLIGGDDLWIGALMIVIPVVIIVLLAYWLFSSSKKKSTDFDTDPQASSGSWQISRGQGQKPPQRTIQSPTGSWQQSRSHAPSTPAPQAPQTQIISIKIFIDEIDDEVGSAVHMLEAGEVSEGEGILDNIIYSSKDKKLLSRALAAKGQIAMLKNKFNDASDFLKDALKYNPTNYHALRDFGFVQLQMKNYDQALEYLTKANQTNPDDLKTQVNIGLYYTETEKFDVAEAALLAVVDLKVDFPDAWAILGYMYEKMNQNEKAVECYEKTLVISYNPLLVQKIIELYKKMGDATKAKITEMKYGRPRALFYDDRKLIKQFER